MLFAEAVTFDPGIVVLVFVIFLAVVLTVAAVVVGGLVAGVKAARDPSRQRAATVWGVCAAVEAAAFLWSLAGGWLEGAVALAAVLAVTAAARFLPAARGTTS